MGDSDEEKPRLKRAFQSSSSVADLEEREHEKIVKEKLSEKIFKTRKILQNLQAISIPHFGFINSGSSDESIEENLFDSFGCLEELNNLKTSQAENAEKLTIFLTSKRFWDDIFIMEKESSILNEG